MRIPITLFGICASIALMMACEDILEVPDISEEPLQLLAPLDSTVVSQNQIDFTWNGIADADAYRVQVALPNFENAAQIVLDSLMVRDTLGQLNTQLTGLLLANGSYQWRVKGLNSGFETLYTTAGFFVDGDNNLDMTPPNTPVLTAPTNGIALDEAEVSFAWTREDVPGTTERDSIYIFRDETLEDLERKALGANKTFVATLSDGTYFWWVTAFDNSNQSGPSEVFEFTVDLP